MQGLQGADLLIGDQFQSDLGGNLSVFYDDVGTSRIQVVFDYSLHRP